MGILIRINDMAVRRKLVSGYQVIRRGRVGERSAQPYSCESAVASVDDLELELSRDYCQAVLDELSNPIWRIGLDGKTLYVNKAWLAFTGRSRQEELRESWLTLVHPEDRQRCETAFTQACEARTPYRMEYRLLHADGTYHAVADVASPLFFHGVHMGHVGSINDLQSLQDTEKRLTRMNDLYAVLSQTGQAILHAQSLEALLQETCDIASRHGKFALAVIAMLEEGAGRLRAVASAGPVLERLAQFQLRIDPGDPVAQGPSTLCLRQGRAVVDQDLQDSGELGDHMREMAVSSGLHAAGIFPLWRKGEIVGTLNLYSDQIGFFEPDRVALLEEMAGEISFAMDLLNAEADRLKAEEKVQQALKRLEDLQAAVDESAIVLVTDSEGKIAFANQRTSEISGYGPDELIGHNPRIMDSRRHPPRFFKEMWETISGGGVWRGEVRNRSKRGSEYWLDTTIVPFLDEGGSPFQYMAISFDITDRRLAEEKLQAISSDRMALLDAASVARVVPWSMDVITGSLRVGDSAFTVLGRPAAAFQAHPASLRELLKPDDQKLLIHHLTEAKAGRTGSFEAPMKRGERQSIWTRWTIARREGYFHGVIQDITEQHDLHGQLLQSQKLESLGTLVGGITHDFNNILMGILGYTEVLSYTPNATPQMQKGVEVIRRAAERGRNLVNQLLKFSHRSISTKAMACLNDSVTEVLELMTLPGEDRITLELELDSQLPEILMDSGQICQAILNLVVNARDAIPGEGLIRFRTGLTTLEPEQARVQDKRPGPYVFLEVEDTGTGMSPELLSRIFEPFFTTKGVGKGTGLGLSVAHGIVESHGGTLKCQSRVGFGTTFRMMLPQITTEMLLEEPEGTDAVSVPVRILLLDDAGTPRSTAAELLAYMGHSVVPLASVERALAAHRSQPFNLMVVNLDMEEGQGVEKLAALQAEIPDLPVLAASHKREPSLRGLLRPPHAVIRWPFQSVELLSTIQRAMG